MKRIIRCLKCGFTFDITYGRTFACSGCPSIVQCGMVKCPKCGHEFPLEPGARGMQVSKALGNFSSTPF